MNDLHNQNPQEVSSFANEKSIVQPLSIPRIPSLDVLRGVAVLLALFVSVWFFGGFSQNQQTGLLLSSKGFDYRLFGAIELLFDGKMRGLIALVFGASMLDFLASGKHTAKYSTHDLFIRRQMWLILFGIINGLLFLWTRDILFHLGIMGMLVFPFIRLSGKALLLAALLATIAYSGKYYWNYSDDHRTYKKYVAVTAAEEKIKKDSTAKQKAIIAAGIKDSTAKKDTLTKKQAREKGAWEGIVADMKYDSTKDDGNKKKMWQTSYINLKTYLMPTFQEREADWTYRFGVWDFAGMIFLGMALFKLNFFNNALQRYKYLLIGLVGLAAGLLLGWYRIHNEQNSLHDYARYITSHALPHTIFFPFERIFMALGYAGIFVFFIGRGANMLWRALANVGRLALTNYIMQSLICMLLFTGFGAGYFGRLTQVQLYFVAFEICLLQIVFSTLWLRRYHIGPAEWLLRCLTYWKWQPFKKKSQTTTLTTSSLTDN